MLETILTTLIYAMRPMIDLCLCTRPSAVVRRLIKTSQRPSPRPWTTSSDKITQSIRTDENCATRRGISLKYVLLTDWLTECLYYATHPGGLPMSVKLLPSSYRSIRDRQKLPEKPPKMHPSMCARQDETPGTKTPWVLNSLNRQESFQETPQFCQFAVVHPDVELFCLQWTDNEG